MSALSNPCATVWPPRWRSSAPPRHVGQLACRQSCGRPISPGDTALVDFEQAIRVNLIGTFLMIRAAVPALLEGVAPAVVNFSSTSSQFAHPYMTAYAALEGRCPGDDACDGHGVQQAGCPVRTPFSRALSHRGMTDGSGTSKDNTGPGSPSDVDFALFGRG